MRYDLEYVLDSALDGIFIVAKDSRLVLFNRACEELFGVSSEDMVNRACLKLSDLENSLNKTIASGKKPPYGEWASNQERMVLRHKDGKEVWVETTYTPILDQENGEIAYVMGVIKDISRQKNLEEERKRLLEQVGHMRSELEKKYNFSNIVGRSSAMFEVLKLAGEVAAQNTTVILQGESGTGKELLARALHYNSNRADKPFVAVNCSAFPETLIESELFGYEKGAFTGAEKSKPGKVQLAQGGTLFLDEVTEMSFPAQAKVLRMIQEREFQPLGGIRTIKADIRIIAATNKNLEQRVREGLFREDLYYRLFVYPIVIPPIRERPEDLPVLVDYFINKLNLEMKRNIKGFSPEAMEILKQYDWPGNVRELQNIIERLMILCKKDFINESDLPQYIIKGAGTTVTKAQSEGLSLEREIQKTEQRMVVQALKKAAFNKTRAAKMLGLTRSTFRYKLARIPRELLAKVEDQ